MALINIEYGSLASSSVMNNNFEYLDNRISTLSESLTAATSSISSVSASITNMVGQIADKIRPIGHPIIRLDDTIFDDEIRLEGAAVSRTTYAALFDIYGIAYGSGDGVSTFNLPDFRDRSIWGSESFGYLAATLPNLEGYLWAWTNNRAVGRADGDLFKLITTSTNSATNNNGDQYVAQFNFNASRKNEIYTDNATVRPPSLAVRVVTRYI